MVVTTAAGTTVKSLFASNVALQPVLMFSLSMVWGLVNGLQIVAYLMLLNVPMTANVLVVDEVFYEIATFDLIPLDWINDYLDKTFGDLDNNGEVYLSATAIDAGFDKTNPIHNLVLPLFFSSITLVFLGLLLLISLFFTSLIKCSRIPLRVYRTVKKKIFWNYYIRLFIEEYIVISMACMIKLFALDISNYFERFSSIFTVLLLIVVLGFPVFVWRFLYKRHEQEVLFDSTFNERWGSLTLDLALRYKSPLLFQVVFMGRRWLLAFIIVALPRWNWAQIQLILFSNSLMMIYAGWVQPYKLPSQNKKELINEVFI